MCIGAERCKAEEAGAHDLGEAGEQQAERRKQWVVINFAYVSKELFHIAVVQPFSQVDALGSSFVFFLPLSVLLMCARCKAGVCMRVGPSSRLRLQPNSSRGRPVP